MARSAPDDMEELKRQVAARLQYLRAGRRRSSYARALRVEPWQIRAYERGEKLPGVRALMLAAIDGSVSLDWLLFGVDRW